MRALAIVDGEHYPDVVREALAELPYEFVGVMLVGGKLADVVEALDVPLGQHQQVRRRLRVDVADRDEAFGTCDVVALAIQLAEEAVLGRAHAASTPSSVTPAPRTRTSSPMGAASSTSHGV